MKKVFLLFLVGLVIVIGLIYIDFKNDPVIEYAIRNGVVTGEKGFLEARANTICLIWVPWFIGLLWALLNAQSKGKKSQEAKQTPKSESQ